MAQDGYTPIHNYNSPQQPPPGSYHCRDFNTEYISILSWNPRGLSSSVPYIQSLLCEKPSVLVLSEHWLWPYDLASLDDISDDYEATGKANSRLTETSNGGKEVGGIAIQWYWWYCHTMVLVVLPYNVTSESVWLVFTIQMTTLTVSIIGVYLPCSDQGMDYYREHLQELERIIIDPVLLGPVIILGDFNGQLCSFGGARGSRNLYLQGVLFSDIMDRHKLCVQSLNVSELQDPFTHMSVETQ